MEKFSKEHILNHVRSRHLSPGDAAASDHFSLVKKVLIVCQICGKNLLRDYLAIKVHVRGQHKMGMVEYAAKFYKEKKKRTSVSVSSESGEEEGNLRYVHMQLVHLIYQFYHFLNTIALRTLR